MLVFDAAVVVKWIKESTHLDSPCGLVLSEISDLTSGMGDVPICYAPTLANQVAHGLAKNALTCVVDRRSSLTEEPRKLQGPRPAALKVKSRFSTVIKKALPIQRTSPVVVYLVSPKIIHVKPHEFMGLVQRLTGREPPTNSSLSSSSSSSSCVMENNKSMMINHDQAVCVPPSSCNLLAAFPSTTSPGQALPNIAVCLQRKMKREN
ncbi:hypothetical protein Ddye_014892 [Dipteronia dyeriana]|uniref:VQ domain-containing protein n=1 Tax=Dipteronia dyeriana TaxID=168575 RepID=A0AAD9WYN1_9ROSI|nr:hypothetical protein Ddye_014892 [Dipteronia dyeriana]